MALYAISKVKWAWPSQVHSRVGGLDVWYIVHALHIIHDWYGHRSPRMCWPVSCCEPTMHIILPLAGESVVIYWQVIAMAVITHTVIMYLVRSLSASYG